MIYGNNLTWWGIGVWFVVGILLCGIWVFANSTMGTVQEALMAVFTAIVQGVLVAGLSTYVNQLIKQAKKNEE